MDCRCIVPYLINVANFCQFEMVQVMYLSERTPCIGLLMASHAGQRGKGPSLVATEKFIWRIFVSISNILPICADNEQEVTSNQESTGSDPTYECEMHRENCYSVTIPRSWCPEFGWAQWATSACQGIVIQRRKSIG